MSQHAPNPLKQMIRALVLGALLLPLAAHASDRDTAPKTGLLWLRSALPAVFPLQVKTAPGRDYHLTLVEDETGQKTLGAFIEGGNFFRVLVPPGTYKLRFAYGAEWQGEAALFGENTELFELDDPLRFGTQGIGTKAGHLVDLRDLITTKEASMVAPLTICQTMRVELNALRDTPFEPGSDITHLPRLIPRYIIYSRICG